MFWSTGTFIVAGLMIVIAISLWLESRLVHLRQASLFAQLAVLGFTLIGAGNVAVQGHESSYPLTPLSSLVSDMGWLLTVLGMAILYILFCLSRAAGNDAAQGFRTGKTNGEHEHTMGEYLR